MFETTGRRSDPAPGQDTGASPNPSATVATAVLHAAHNPASHPASNVANNSVNNAAPKAARTAGHDAALWLSCMLDEIDYGMLLLAPDGDVTYLNHAARVELDAHHPLRLNGTVVARRPIDTLLLGDALAAAQRGLRGLVTLGEGEHRVSISVVPLPAPASAATSAVTTAAGHPAAPSRRAAVATLLVLGKRQMCEQLSVQGFARSVHLTPAETRVLELLCSGVRPSAVAVQQGVAVSTVRTQIGSIRAKTGAGSIRELVRQVAVLPPLVGALRSSSVLR